MTARPLLLFSILSLPCVYWTHGVESRAALEAAGVTRICVVPERVDSWRAAGFFSLLRRLYLSLYNWTVLFGWYTHPFYYSSWLYISYPFSKLSLY